MRKKRNVAVKYLFEREGIYYFRYQTSCQERKLIGIAELKISLKTRDLNYANFLAVHMSRQIKRVMFMAKQLNQLDKAQIKKIVKEYFFLELEKVKKALASSNSDNSYDPTHESEMWYQDKLSLEQSLSTHKYSKRTSTTAKCLVERGGFELPEEGSVLLDELYQAVVRADMERARIGYASLSGDVEGQEIKDPMLTTKTLVISQDEGLEDQGLLLSEAIEKYKGYSKEIHQKKTIGDVNRVLSWLEQWVGDDRPIKSISQSGARDFRDALKAVPKNNNKDKKLKGLLFPTLVEVDKSHERVAVKTSSKSLGFIRAFYTWCVNEGYCDGNPFLSLTIKGQTTSEPKRVSFETTELTLLFNSPLFTGYKTLRYWRDAGKIIKRRPEFWVFLIGMLSGMRLGEILQLQSKDIRQVDNIWVFDINIDGGDKTTKNSQSIRNVPIHNKLLKLGILKWAHKSSAKVDDMLFPSLIGQVDGDVTNKASKILNNYLRKIGITSSKKVFHSFRHSFADQLFEHTDDYRKRNAIMGHVGSTSADGYGSNPPLKKLSEVVQKTYSHINLSHLSKMKD